MTSNPLDLNRIVAFGDIPVVVNPAVPAGEIWFVQSPFGPTDKRTAAERTTRIINVAPNGGTNAH